MPYIGRQGEFGIRNRFQYLASADDTSVSGSDANGVTMTFSDGLYIDVYLNGVKLKAGEDYNTTTANTVAGISAMSANDEVEIIVYDAFTVADTVSATDGGTFSGAVTFNGDISVGDDLTLGSDGAIVNFGNDSDVTLTHVADTGLTVASGTNDTKLQVNSNAADGDAAPYIILNRTSDSPADDDNGGTIQYHMENDNNQQFVASSIGATASDVSDGTEDAYLSFATMIAGTLTNGLQIQGGRINSSAYSPAGSVVQVVQNATTGSIGTTSTSYVDVTNCTIDITCASTSNKVLMLFDSYTSYTLVASTNVSGTTRILRDATQLISRTIQVASSAGGEQGIFPMSGAYLDSPASTDALTYKAQELISTSSSTMTNTQAWIILMEIQV